MARQDDHVRHTIRIPRDVYERICALPGEGSINAKIINALDASSGETLRDRFAMAAATGLLASPDPDLEGIAAYPDNLAADAYAMADAMMRRRVIQDEQE